jgi:hypothetical protein
VQLGWTAEEYCFEGQEIYVFSKMSRPAVELTQPPIQWVSGILSLEQSGRGVK